MGDAARGDCLHAARGRCLHAILHARRETTGQQLARVARACMHSILHASKMHMDKCKRASFEVAPTGGRRGARFKAARTISALPPSTSLVLGTRNDLRVIGLPRLMVAVHPRVESSPTQAQLHAHARLRLSVWREHLRRCDDAIDAGADLHGEPSHASGSVMRSIIDRDARAGAPRRTARPPALQQLPSCIAVHSSPSRTMDRKVWDART